MKPGKPVDSLIRYVRDIVRKDLMLIRMGNADQKRLLIAVLMGVQFPTLMAHSHPIQSADSLIRSSDSRFTYQVQTTRTGQGDQLACSVAAISVFDKATSQLRQRIKPEKNDQDCQQLGSALVVEDMNFDGYNDIRIRQFMPAAPNIPYYVWLYDPQTNRFARNTALEEITSPVVDRVHQRIRSAWRANCCDYGEDTYGFLNGQLTLLQQTETTLDPANSNQTITTLKQRVKGQMNLIRQTTARIEH